MTLTRDNITIEGLLDTASARFQTNIIITAAGTVALTSASTFYQMFTGSTSGQILQLPDARTITSGWTYNLWNSSSVIVNVQDAVGNAIVTLYPLDATIVVLQVAGTQAGTWVYDRTGTAGISAMTICFWGKQSKNFYLSGGVSSTTTSDVVPLRFPRAAKIIGYGCDNSLLNGSVYSNYILYFREVSNLGVNLATIPCGEGRYNGGWNPAGYCTYAAGQGLSLYMGAGSDNANVTISALIYFVWA